MAIAAPPGCSPALDPGTAAIDAPLERAIAWLSSPPVRYAEGPHRGALSRGLDRRTGGSLGVYTEITGYAVALFVSLARSLGRPGLLGAAREAGDFLERIQHPDGAYPDVPAATPAAEPVRLFAFDTSMCVVGMLELAQATGEPRYSSSAVRAGEWLLTLQRPGGSFHSLVENGRRRDAGGFYGDGSVIHAKNALALLRLAARTGDSDFERGAAAACEWALDLQRPDGAFWPVSGARQVVTHAHCYACEGLFYAGTLLGRRDLMDAASRGVAWLARHQGSDGGLPALCELPWGSRGWAAQTARRTRATDATAQAARLFRLAGEEYAAARGRALAFLSRRQGPDGGLVYTRSRWGESPLLYTWCTQFAAQAWAWERRPPGIRELV